MKASMAIAAQLRRRIAQGELAPGDPLPSENDLTADLGYSKPTVREALRILENEGLIEVRRGIRGGPRIRRLSISEVAKPMGVYLQIGDVAVSDVWVARDRIIGAAIERLAATPEVDLRPLEEEIETLAAHVGDLASFYPLMISTAEVAVELAGNVTDHLVVTALRHVVELELAAATEAVRDVDMDAAVAAERDIADSWRRALRSIRLGRPRAARAAYDEQTAMLAQLADVQQMTVGHALSAPPEELVHAHAAHFASVRPDPAEAATP